MAAGADFAELTAALIALMKQAAPGMRVLSEGPAGLQLTAEGARLYSTPLDMPPGWGGRA